MRSSLRAAKDMVWRALMAARDLPVLKPWANRAIAGARRREYAAWLRAYGDMTDASRAEARATIAAMASAPLISVIVPVYETPRQWLDAAIQSVRGQVYPHWELCLSDDASTDPEVRRALERHAAEDARIRLHFRAVRGHISANSNDALALATGDYIALLDADDVLSEDALYRVAVEIAAEPSLDMIFSDEDKIDPLGRRVTPNFKPDWNLALMLAQNAFSHLGVVRRSLVERAGRFREGLEGAQDHDLALRCSRLTDASRIRHIPRVLYQWREAEGSTAAGADRKPYATAAARRAVSEHLAALGLEAEIEAAPNDWLQVHYRPNTTPTVSIVIPTTAGALFHRCAESLFDLTAYPHLEVLVLVAEKHREPLYANARTKALIDEGRLTPVIYPDQPFNYSRVNNLGVRQAKGEVVCLLNDDIEVISGDWLERMVTRVMLPGVGAVGPRLLYPDGTVQHAGVILGVGGVAAHQFAGRPRDYLGPGGRAVLEQDLSCVTAACLVTRRDIYQAVGGLDEAFPVAFNDVDLCLRIRQAGHRIIWTPAAELVHHESATFGSHNSPARQEQFAKDCRMMRERWAPVLDNDPYYNPNMSLEGPFGLAWPPRRPV
ncbi:MAG: glycosyltransferase [Caulobacteraceae bacterium]